MTKQVTAALVMQQVDSGRISLDEPVTRYLPAFGGHTGREVTVRQLLQHTSGLPNPDDTPRDGDGFPAFSLARGAGTAPERGRALIVFTNSAAVEFGEIWQGKGLSHQLLSAAVCEDPE